MSRKTFKHILVPKAELETVTINGKRHYALPDGTHLKSVTTVLSEKLDKTALLEWKKRVGEEEAQRISTQAARRGTAVHTLAENYVLNQENYIPPNTMPINIESFKPIKKALDNHVDNVLGVELPLWSKALGCAGRTDLVAEYDNRVSIIDFKTSRRLKKEDWIESYFLQSTIYSMMFERIYSIAVPQIVIVLTVDDEMDAQIFIKDRSKYVNRAIEVLTT